jgi:hypothetical protein
VSRRATVIPALAAVLVAAIALVVHPLLTDPTRTTSPPTTVSGIPAPPPGPAPVAERAARQALACPVPTPGEPPSAGESTPSRWCGPLTLTRRQTSCQTAVRCVVELIGTLHAADAPTAIALSVTMRRSPRGWRPVEVSS